MAPECRQLYTFCLGGQFLAKLLYVCGQFDTPDMRKFNSETGKHSFF